MRNKQPTKSVPLFRVGPPGHFIHVPITTPVVSALKNYYIQSFLEVLTDFFNHYWIQMTVSLLKPAARRLQRQIRHLDPEVV